MKDWAASRCRRAAILCGQRLGHAASPAATPAEKPRRRLGHLRAPAWSFAVAATCLITLGGPATGAAQVVDLRTASDNSDGRALCEVWLTWSEPATVGAERERDELILRFDRPVDHASVSALATPLQHYIAGMWSGYDSLVLRLQPGVEAEAQAVQGRVRVALWRNEAMALAEDATPQTAQARPADEGRRRLRRLKADLLFSLGKPLEAIAALSALRADAPDDPSLALAESAIESSIGRWRRAAALYAEGQRLQGAKASQGRPLPGSAEAPQLIGHLVYDHQAGAASRRGLRLAGHGFVSDGLRASFAAELADSTVEPGVGNGLQSGLAIQALVGARYDAFGGHHLALMGGGGGGGAALLASAGLWDVLGETALRLAYGEARWELPATAALRTRRDALEIVRTFRPTAAMSRALRGELRTELRGHVERWRPGEVDVSRDAAVLGAVGRYTSWAARPRLWLQLSARAFLPFAVSPPPSPGSAKAVGAARAGLLAIAARSRVLAIDAGAELRIGRWWQLEAQLGHGWNLDGPDAVQVGAALMARPPIGLLGGLRVHRGLAPSAGAPATTSATLQVGAAF